MSSTYEQMKHIRNSWGDFNPITRIEKNKKKYSRKQKHKKKEEKYYEI